jgi:quercetin dioxygenase-like cupin family protein
MTRHIDHKQKSRLALLLLSAASLALTTGVAYPAPLADVREIMTKELTDFPGKEGLMLTVTYPPGGAADEIHRHDAHAFLYVLEGSIVMQVKGGPEVTLKPGESFYEGPNDLHIVGRNASATQPAKFVVVLIKNKGAPPFIPVK